MGTRSKMKMVALYKYLRVLKTKIKLDLDVARLENLCNFQKAMIEDLQHTIELANVSSIEAAIYMAGLEETLVIEAETNGTDTDLYQILTEEVQRIIKEWERV